MNTDMPCLLLAALALFMPLPAQTPAADMDVSTLRVGSPSTVTELDLGKLKGDLRQVGWSSDGTELYVQTAEGAPPSEKLHHYTGPVAGGSVKAMERQPDWAANFWVFKSDRSAPGIGSLMIDMEQKLEKTKEIGRASCRERV